MLATLPVVSLSAIPIQAACLTAPTKHLVANGAVVTDQKTGLIWTRCALGMTWNNKAKNCMGDPESMNQAAAREAANKAGEGWRVPEGDELETLLLDTCTGPKIDTAAFPAIHLSDVGEGAKFWTSTEAMPDLFYYFDFANGYADIHSSGYRLSVLLVKKR